MFNFYQTMGVIDRVLSLLDDRTAAPARKHNLRFASVLSAIYDSNAPFNPMDLTLSPPSPPDASPGTTAPLDGLVDDEINLVLESLPLWTVAAVMARLSRRMRFLSLPHIARRLKKAGVLLDGGLRTGYPGEPTVFPLLGIPPEAGAIHKMVPMDALMQLYAVFHPERSFAVPEVLGRLRLSPQDLTRLVSHITFVKSPNIAPEPPGVTVGRYLRKSERIRRSDVRYVGLQHTNPQFSGLIDRFDLILIGQDVAMRPREGSQELQLFAESMADRMLQGSFEDPRFQGKQIPLDRSSCIEAISALILAEFPINLAAAYIESLVESVDKYRGAEFDSAGWTKAIGILARMGNMERVARRIVGLDWRNIDMERFERAKDLLGRCEAAVAKMEGEGGIAVAK